VIPNGIEVQRFELPRRPVPGRILMVGRLAPPKRPDLALRALALLRRTRPEAELHVVGDGTLRPEAERLAGELGLGEAVRFLGTRADLPELLAESDCLLLASDYEGFPLVVIEAMAAAVPVVATDVGGIHELIEHGRTGFVAAAGDAAALAGALEVVFADPQQARRLGEQGRQVARARLAIEQMIAQVLDVYAEVDPGRK
jgi:glycosyltransferase involved in cell wall biosynthesis